MIATYYWILVIKQFFKQIYCALKVENLGWALNCRAPPIDVIPQHLTKTPNPVFFTQIVP